MVQAQLKVLRRHQLLARSIAHRTSMGSLGLSAQDMALIPQVAIHPVERVVHRVPQVVVPLAAAEAVAAEAEDVAARNTRGCNSADLSLRNLTTVNKSGFG